MSKCALPFDPRGESLELHVPEKSLPPGVMLIVLIVDAAEGLATYRSAL